MDEVRALALTGALGSGYLTSTLETALAWDPDFIGVDAGSTDSGPASLGTGECSFSRAAVKRDIKFALLGARQKCIPLLVGSAGTAGGDLNLAWMVEIVEEISREEELHFKLAVIHSEQDKQYLKRRFAEGRIKPLRPAPTLDESVIERSDHIVGMMGAEPYIRALEDGAEVVIAGRSSDTSIFAAIPMQRGFDPGLVWHAAKILECGAASVVYRKHPDCMFARIRKDHFLMEPPNEEQACSPLSVAAHALYENSSPFDLYEPSGRLDIRDAVYTAESDRTVKVAGARFVPAERYTIKLEGAERVGFQSIVLGGIRDPELIGQIDSWLELLREKVTERTTAAYGPAAADCLFTMRVYGKNGVLGKAEPLKDTVSHELMLIMEATAPTQEMATSIASSARHIGLHLPIPQWKGLISALAFPYTPAHLERGPVYRFTLNHILEPDDPFEMFPMELRRI